MDAARWDRTQSLFHRAAAIAPPERLEFLRAECVDEPALIEDVLSLLATESEHDELLDGDLAQVAHAVLEGDDPRRPPHDAFGPYRIRSLLGEGGMGVVYLAERADLGSLAAIKILRDAWLSPLRRERFTNEQRTLAQLNHPLIARLYDAGTLADGTPWIVMEYVEGLPLTEYCRVHASSLAGRLLLFRAVIQAVLHAHQHLIIHRDLKPSNILVTADGTVKLLDFGIAKQMAPDDLGAQATVTGLRLMTPAYASPEQIRGETVGTQTDVYSLGVLLYELLCGRLPFDIANRSPGEAEAMILEQEPERPSVVARGSGSVPGMGSPSRGEWADLDVLCLTAMRKDPRRRYNSVAALLRDVDRFLARKPLDARPDSAAYRLRKFASRNRVPLTATLVAAAVIVSLATTYAVRLAAARNAALAQSARTQRIQQFMLSLFAGGEEDTGPADTLRVVTMVDRGLQEARSLDAEPEVQAELYLTLGTIYQQLGQLSRADSLLRASLEQRKALLGPQDPTVGTSLVALGMLRDAQAQYDDAERFVRQGLDLQKRALGAGDIAVGRSTASLGQVLEDRGSYVDAIPVLEEAVRILTSADSTAPEVSATITLLANTHFYLGHYAMSDSLNRRVLAIDERLYGEHHPHVADDLINLGAIQYDGGGYADAERYYRRACDITVAWYGVSHPETASCLTMLGRAIVSQGRYDEADDILRRALAVQERVYGPVHPRVASTLNELGKVAQGQKRLDEAAAHFARMAAIYRTVYHDKHYLIGVAMSNLASVSMDRHDYVTAERIFRDVLQRYDSVLPPDHQLVGIARVRLGRALLLERRYAESAKESERGFEILSRQSGASPKWLGIAREDLAEANDSLHRPGEAARFRGAPH